MSALILKDDGYPKFKKIIHKRKWIGRVCSIPDGTFLGIIGRIEVRAASEREAFDEVGARFFGYENAEALRSKNSVVRAQRRAAKSRAEYAMTEMLRGNFEPLDRMLGFSKQN